MHFSTKTLYKTIKIILKGLRNAWSKTTRFRSHLDQQNPVISTITGFFIFIQDFSVPVKITLQALFLCLFAVQNNLRLFSVIKAKINITLVFALPPQNKVVQKLNQRISVLSSVMCVFV